MTIRFSPSVGVQPQTETPLKDAEATTEDLKEKMSSGTVNTSFSVDQRTQSVSFALENCGSNDKPARDRCESYSTVQSTGIAATNNSFAFSLAEETSSEEGDITMPPAFAEKLVAQINRRVEVFLGQSPFIAQNSNMDQIARFSREELSLGETIAKGGFSHIVEIHSFHKKIHSEQQPENEYRPCVIKHLNPALPLKKLPGGGKDLAFEARTLAALNHNNIIKMRGWSQDGLDGFKTSLRADGFFIVLDRLGETLFQRIFHWQDKKKRNGRYSKLKASQYRIQKELLEEKMQVAVDISSALAYCHSKNIMHRDLKSANVAFDLRDGRALLIDFGLAVEVETHKDPNHTFDLTGNIGTARYMSPEVIQQQPYGMKADVFSFCILLWECLAAKKPYANHDAKRVKEYVSKWGERPKIYWSWPRKVRHMMRQGWSRRQEDRPTMAEVHEILANSQKSLLERAKLRLTR